MRIDYNKLSSIAVDPTSRTTLAKDTSEVLASYLQLLSDLIFACDSLTESEMAMIIHSLDRWVKNKISISTKKYKVGSIVQLDWGINYSPELSYKHPALVIEEWTNTVLVIPTTSNASAVANAYHPIDNPNGKWYYRKVGTAEGFAHDCALIINNAKIVSKARILSISGNITSDISKPENVFREVKGTMIKNFFSKEWAEHKKLEEAYNKEVEKNKQLQEQYDKLIEDYNALKNNLPVTDQTD